MSTKRHITRSVIQMGSATMLSRILGFIRDIIIANKFGTGMIADAFVMAFSIPNLLRDLIAEGSTNAAIVPLLTEELTKKGKEKFWHASAVLLNISIVVLLIITALGILASPLIVRFIASGFLKEPDKFNLTVHFTQLLFPFIFLIGLTAYTTGVLNSLKHFLIPSLGPCIFNISLIFFTLLMYERFGAYGLITGVLVGGALQLLIQIPIMLRKGFRPYFKIDFYHPLINKVLKLLSPRLLGTSVYQINFIVSRIIASWLPGGAVASLYFANRLFQLPLGIFAIAIAQAALPSMSEEVARNDMGKLKSIFNFSLRYSLYIAIPASAGLIFLSRPIVAIFFQHGAFGPRSTYVTSMALIFYGLGLFAVGGIKIATSCFYSLQDTWTPVKTAFAAFILNVIFSLILMKPMQVAGLALAATLAVSLNFIFLMVELRKRIGPLSEMPLFKLACKVACASVIMGVLSRALFYAGASLAGTSIILRALSLIITIIASIIIFFFLSFIFKVDESVAIYRWISKKS